MTGRELPGICDASAAVALHPPTRPRWLSPRYHLHRRLALVLVTFAAGFASALFIRGG